jgi:hypothetical protein
MEINGALSGKIIDSKTSKNRLVVIKGHLENMKGKIEFMFETTNQKWIIVHCHV